MGPSWACWAYRSAIPGRLEGIFGRLGALLGPSWAVLGASWAVLAPSWAVLGASWEPLGPSWDGLGGLLDRLQRREGRKVAYAKMYVFLKTINDFGLLEPSWDASWGVLEASSAVLGPSWACWADRSAIRGRLGGI